MAKANGKLGDIGWELKAEHSKNVTNTDETKIYDYYIINPLLIDNETYPHVYNHPLMWSVDNNAIQDLKWFIDDTALVTHPNIIKLQTRGTYESYDVTKFSDALFYRFLNLTPETDHEYIKEMSCLIWLNNMNYNPIFSMMVRSNEESLKRYIKIMSKIKNDYTHLEDFAKTAVDYYLLPKQYSDALF